MIDLSEPALINGLERIVGRGGKAIDIFGGGQGLSDYFSSSLARYIPEPEQLDDLISALSDAPSTGAGALSAVEGSDLANNILEDFITRLRNTPKLSRATKKILQSKQFRETIAEYIIIQAKKAQEVATQAIAFDKRIATLVKGSQEGATGRMYDLAREMRKKISELSSRKGDLALGEDDITGELIKHFTNEPKYRGVRGMLDRSGVDYATLVEAILRHSPEGKAAADKIKDRAIEAGKKAVDEWDPSKHKPSVGGTVNVTKEAMDAADGIMNQLTRGGNEVLKDQNQKALEKMVELAIEPFHAAATKGKKAKVLRPGSPYLEDGLGNYFYGVKEYIDPDMSKEVAWALSKKFIKKHGRKIPSDRLLRAKRVPEWISNNKVTVGTLVAAVLGVTTWAAWPHIKKATTKGDCQAIFSDNPQSIWNLYLSANPDQNIDGALSCTYKQANTFLTKKWKEATNHLINGRQLLWIKIKDNDGMDMYIPACKPRAWDGDVPKTNCDIFMTVYLKNMIESVNVTIAGVDLHNKIEDIKSNILKHWPTLESEAQKLEGGGEVKDIKKPPQLPGPRKTAGVEKKGVKEKLSEEVGNVLVEGEMPERPRGGSCEFSDAFYKEVAEWIYDKLSGLGSGVEAEHIKVINYFNCGSDKQKKRNYVKLFHAFNEVLKAEDEEPNKNWGPDGNNLVAWYKGDSREGQPLWKLAELINKWLAWEESGKKEEAEETSAAEDVEPAEETEETSAAEDVEPAEKVGGAPSVGIPAATSGKKTSEEEKVTEVPVDVTIPGIDTGSRPATDVRTLKSTSDKSKSSKGDKSSTGGGGGQEKPEKRFLGMSVKYLERRGWVWDNEEGDFYMKAGKWVPKGFKSGHGPKAYYLSKDHCFGRKYCKKYRGHKDAARRRKMKKLETFKGAMDAGAKIKPERNTDGTLTDKGKKQVAVRAMARMADKAIKDGPKTKAQVDASEKAFIQRAIDDGIDPTKMGGGPSAEEMEQMGFKDWPGKGK